MRHTFVCVLVIVVVYVKQPHALDNSLALLEHAALAWEVKTE